MNGPENPAGPFVAEATVDAGRREELIAAIEAAPAALAEVVAGLSDTQLSTRYRNWTARQIVHHLADSHLNSFLRFKWALTEDAPLIKAYDEGRWAELDDSRHGDVAASLELLRGLHARWVRLLRSMADEHFARTFRHPESGRLISLSEALSYYVWHGRHHTAQLLWIRQNKA